MIKNITCTFFLLISISLYSQVEKLNNYKYIIVPDKFHFVKSKDGYSTSSLTKFLLKKKGFEVYLSNDTFPEELNSNRCLSLEASVVDNSGMFKTKNQIVFKDCYKKEIFKTEVGVSKEKEYRKAYHEAIRDAYNSMSKFSYTYKPSKVNVISNNGVKNDNFTTATPTIKVVEKPIIISRPIVTPNVNKTKIKKEVVVSSSLDILYAQPKINGFQLVNMKPEVVFIVLKTNVEDVFIIKGKNGILYKNGDNWFSEFYENNQLVRKEYQIKF